MNIHTIGYLISLMFAVVGTALTPGPVRFIGGAVILTDILLLVT